MPIIVHWEKDGKQDSLWFDYPTTTETSGQLRERIEKELKKRGYKKEDCWSEGK